MSLKLRRQENPWRLMLAANVAVVIGVFLYKLTREPYVPYIHLLVDYHFGFTKRALIGATLSLFFPKTSVWLVFALSGLVWLVTTGLFIKLFHRTFALWDRDLPLFVLMAGSPFFLKNFMYTLGHFDIYGCMLAISLLLAPARSVAFVIVAALGSMILILIHHIHLLMYVPTITVIVVLRYYLVLGFNRWNVAIGVFAAACVVLLFFSAQFFGTMTVPKEDFIRHLQSRMADPARTDLLQFSYIWYQPLSKEILDTWQRLPSNILGIPVFALLIWLHSPVWKYFASSVRALSDEWHRRTVTASVVLVSAGYLIMFAIVFDYSRWISNWAVCMFLILHAVKALPASKPVPPVSFKDRANLALGWVATLVPRVGIVRPF
ncbi:MAG TPA: hypothetical protein VJV58_14295 [Bradyrhizobium sp.]|nr:hypothetical protein [Bradyrhizobium sp.]HKO72095.1 hypothetical protein [Bradyrhizobium sp.]